MWEEEKEFHDPLETSNLRILSITWNMNAKKPPKDLFQLLRPDIKHDIISVGTEECLKSIFKSAFGANKIKWVEMLREHLGDEYQVLASHSLMGIHLVVFASVRIIPLITNIQSNHVATGIMNTVGNKGGIGVCFNVGKTSFLFVNCHLASGESNKRDKRRTEDFNNIDLRLKLPYRYNLKEESKIHKLDLSRVSNRFDCCIWAGDMNFRISTPLSVIVSLMKNNQFDALKDNEQLNLNFK